jgi:hypothetical protein
MKFCDDSQEKTLEFLGVTAAKILFREQKAHLGILSRSRGQVSSTAFQGLTVSSKSWRDNLEVSACNISSRSVLHMLNISGYG